MKIMHENDQKIFGRITDQETKRTGTFGEKTFSEKEIPRDFCEEQTIIQIECSTDAEKDSKEENNYIQPGSIKNNKNNDSENYLELEFDSPLWSLAVQYMDAPKWIKIIFAPFVMIIGILYCICQTPDVLWVLLTPIVTALVYYHYGPAIEKAISPYLSRGEVLAILLVILVICVLSFWYDYKEFKKESKQNHI